MDAVSDLQAAPCPMLPGTAGVSLSQTAMATPTAFVSVRHSEQTRQRNSRRHRGNAAKGREQKQLLHTHSGLLPDPRDRPVGTSWVLSVGGLEGLRAQSIGSRAWMTWMRWT